MLNIKLATDPEAVQGVQTLWKEYWSELGLPGGFQNFEEELRTLPGKYAAPRGALAIAYIDGLEAGAVALRPLDRNSCELKHLYVRPRFRRRGTGRRLMEWIIEHARVLGFRTVHGDTLPTMTQAMEMYHDLGFHIVDHPYSNDPTPGAIYLELRF